MKTYHYHLHSDLDYLKGMEIYGTSALVGEVWAVNMTMTGVI